MAKSKKILIVDDDEKLLNLLTKYFRNFGFDSETASHPQIALMKLEKNDYELVVLDVMLPDMDGFEIVKNIRKTSQIPIIMLTARGDVTDRIVGLELGADDYLAKPFEPRELVVRIQSILRRSKSSSETSKMVLMGPLKIDLVKRNVFLNNSILDFSTAEFEILKLFIENPGRTFNRDEIMDRLKGNDWNAFDRSIDVLVSRLRQKLNDDPKKPNYIKTIWGTGYRFIGQNEV